MHICRQHSKMPPSLFFFFFVFKSRWHQFKMGDKRGEETQTSQIKLTSLPLHKLVGSGVCLEIQINASESIQTVLWQIRQGFTWDETMSLTKQKNFQGSSPIELAVMETLITSKKRAILEQDFPMLSSAFWAVVWGNVFNLWLWPRLSLEPSSKIINLFVS